MEGLEKNKGFDLTMTAKKNDRLLSKGNFSDITYSFAEMIVWASQERLFILVMFLDQGPSGRAVYLSYDQKIPRDG